MQLIEELEDKLPVPPKAKVQATEEFDDQEAELLKELLEDAPTRKPIVEKKKPLLVGGGSGDDEEALLAELQQSMT